MFVTLQYPGSSDERFVVLQGSVAAYFAMRHVSIPKLGHGGGTNWAKSRALTRCLIKIDPPACLVDTNLSSGTE